MSLPWRPIVFKVFLVGRQNVFLCSGIPPCNFCSCDWVVVACAAPDGRKKATQDHKDGQRVFNASTIRGRKRSRWQLTGGLFKLHMSNALLLCVVTSARQAETLLGLILLITNAFAPQRVKDHRSRSFIGLCSRHH